MALSTANTLKSKALSDLEAGKLAPALKKAQLGAKKHPKDSDFHAIAGFVLSEMERYKQSIPYFAEAARLKPEDPQFAENLANALMQTGQIPRALAYAEQKLTKFPNNRELLRVIDEIELKTSNWREVIKFATKRLDAEPENIQQLIWRSRAYGHVGFVDASARDIERAYEIAPEDEGVAYNMAVNLHQRGRKQDCLDILDRILAANESHTASLLRLSTLVSKAEASDLLPKVEAASKVVKGADVDLGFAKAHLLSKSDGLDAAMPYYARANAAHFEINPYDADAEDKKLEQICAMFPAGADLPSSGVVASPTPIFVIGQPRSGTTLMEMMLSSAPGVAGCGELTLANELSQPLVDAGKAFTAEETRRFAQSFRDLTPPIPDGTTHFVDKMPHNYQRVGFLLTAFPNAKVINMMRDPRDVGLSKWIRLFPAGGMRYTSNLEAIVHSANLYRKYLAHWDTVFGDRILTVRYEDLVADPETHSRAVADFCGVAWSERMMHPEENEKQVSTASIDQVRSKISTKSIGGWRDVATHLMPAFAGFDQELWPEYNFGE